LVAEGEVVAVRYIERGTSVKSFRGQGPTGKSYEVVAMEFFEFKGGFIHRRWGARDAANIGRQLGFTQI
jgi:predicted ester cyclase